MINIGKICFFVFMIFILSACDQKKSKQITVGKSYVKQEIEQTKSRQTILGKSYAEQELKRSLSNNEQFNVIDNKTVIIKDSVTAIMVAEPILFSLFGKDNIVNQRPYEIYLIDNYWVISGTLPKGRLGGTFLIIINDKNSSVIKITHGK